MGKFWWLGLHLREEEWLLELLSALAVIFGEMHQIEISTLILSFGMI